MSALQLDITLAPSRIYAGGLLLLYGISFPILLFANLPIFLRLLLLLAAAGLSVHAWRAWRKVMSFQRLLVLQDGFRLVRVDGEEIEAKGGAKSLLTGHLIILHLVSAQGVYWLPLLLDSADAEDLRRLRVWLRCRYSDLSLNKPDLSFNKKVSARHKI